MASRDRDPSTERRPAARDASPSRSRTNEGPRRGAEGSRSRGTEGTDERVRHPDAKKRHASAKQRINRAAKRRGDAAPEPTSAEITSKRSESTKRSEGTSKRTESTPKRTEGTPKRSEGTPKRSESTPKRPTTSADREPRDVPDDVRTSAPKGRAGRVTSGAAQPVTSGLPPEVRAAIKAAKQAAAHPALQQPAPPPKPARRGPAPTDVRAGRVAIVGRPNVGKSTLLNTLLGQKLAIATAKPGTTRTVLLGVYDGIDDEDRRTQIAFLDTPGLESPRSVLGRVIVEEAQGALEGVDAIVLLVEATDVARGGDLAPADTRVATIAKAAGKPIVLALNKVDRLKDKEKLLPVLEKLTAKGGFVGIVPISATRGTNVQGLVRELRELLSPGLLYEDDTLTDRPERFFVAELVREVILETTRNEVPYSAAVQIDEWVDEGELARIGVTIVVEKDTHKGILIGARGQMLKEIGEAARHRIEGFLGRKVFLRTFVKVVPGWTKDAQKVRELVREGALS